MTARKSPVLKALTGEKRPSRLRVAVSADRPAACPEPPADLTGVALTIWRDLAPKVWRAGYLQKTDATAFAILCGILATERQARLAIALEGLTTRSEAGTLKAHPALRAAETARAQARSYLESFGLTPAGRQRIEPSPHPATKSPWSQFDEFAA